MEPGSVIEGGRRDAGNAEIRNLYVARPVDKYVLGLYIPMHQAPFVRRL
jgi:hypothetical protein